MNSMIWEPVVKDRLTHLAVASAHLQPHPHFSVLLGNGPFLIFFLRGEGGYTQAS